MTLVSSHHFPRHSHDQFGIGVIAFGAQRSWSGVGSVQALAGDVIMSNPGEMHDGAPLDGDVRGWRMLYLDPALLAREVEEEIVGQVEIVRPVARDSVLAGHFARLFGCLTAPRSDRLASDENLLRSLIYMLRQHGTARLSPGVPSPCVAKAIQHLDSAPDTSVSLAELAALSGVSRFQLLRGFAREIGITPHALSGACFWHGDFWLMVKLLSGQLRGPASRTRAIMTRAFVRQLGITPGRYRAAVA